MTTKEAVMVQLDEVEDPELDLSIVELGLVYDVRFEEKDEGLHAEVDLTLTSPGCPAAPEIMAAAHRAALQTEVSHPFTSTLFGPHGGTRRSTPAKTLAWTWVSGIEAKRLKQA
jgi:metal-sulfur cluster biosynthetic enzyme